MPIPNDLGDVAPGLCVVPLANTLPCLADPCFSRRGAARTPRASLPAHATRERAALPRSPALALRTEPQPGFLLLVIQHQWRRDDSPPIRAGPAFDTSARPGPGSLATAGRPTPRTKWVRLPQGTRSGLLSAQLTPGILLAQWNCLNALPKLSSPTFCPPRPSTPPLQAPFISTAPSLGDGHSLFQILASRNILVSTRATPSNDSSYADRLKRWFRFLGSFFSPNSGMNATTCYKASD